MRIVGAIAVLPVLFASSGAQALCLYKGEDNAKITIEQEFKDSRWVVRAEVLSAEDHFSDGEAPWSLYRIEVKHTYKGHPARQLGFFTFRDSGGFYMDRAWVRSGPGHDIGGEYLLFLNPIPPSADLPAAAEGAVFVNYSCGVSGPWAQVPAAARDQLSALERGR